MAAAPSAPQLPATVTAEHTSLQFPGQPEWIAPAVEYLARKAVLCGACQEARVSKVTIALHEALTNAVIHGNLQLSSDLKELGDNAFAEALAARATDPVLGCRVVDIRIDYDGTCCRWAITDQGQGFDVERVLRRAAGDGPDALLASGRGVLLMRAFLDDVRYEAGGRRVVLTLHRHSGAEQRRHGRLALQKPVRVAPIRADGSVDWDAAYEAVSHNLSAGGMGLLQEGLAATGRVLLALDWEGRTLYLPAEVRHCQSLGGNTVEIGCRFQADAPLPPGALALDTPSEVAEAVGRLLEEVRAQDPCGDDRRAHPREFYSERITILSPSGPIPGFARNLSRGGISFLAVAPLPAETVVLSLPQRNAGPLRVRARVVRCVKVMEGIHDVAAQFLGFEPGL